MGGELMRVAQRLMRSPKVIEDETALLGDASDQPLSAELRLMSTQPKGPRWSDEGHKVISAEELGALRGLEPRSLLLKDGLMNKLREEGAEA